MQADSLPAEPPGRPNVYSIVEMGLYSMLCASLDGRGVWGRMGTCIRIAEFFRCSSETITALLTGYNPIYNKKNFLRCLYNSTIFLKPEVNIQNVNKHFKNNVECSSVFVLSPTSFCILEIFITLKSE